MKRETIVAAPQHSCSLIEDAESALRRGQLVEEVGRPKSSIDLYHLLLDPLIPSIYAEGPPNKRKRHI